MKEDFQPPEKPQETPQAVAKKWLYHFEQCARQRAYVDASELFHKNCVYFGLEDDDRQIDWSATWTKQQAFSIDLREANIIAEENLMLCTCPWLSRAQVVHRGDLMMGRATFALMRFEKEKILCVHCHLSKRP